MMTEERIAECLALTEPVKQEDFPHGLDCLDERIRRQIQSVPALRECLDEIKQLKVDATLGKILLHYVERLNDPTPEDPLTLIVAQMLSDIWLNNYPGNAMQGAIQEALLEAPQ